MFFEQIKEIKDINLNTNKKLLIFFLSQAHWAYQLRSARLAILLRPRQLCPL